MSSYVLGFQDIDNTTIMVVGGKGANLRAISKVGGIRVPAKSQHVVPAKLVHEFLWNDPQERGEKTTLLSNSLVRTLRKFQVC